MATGCTDANFLTFFVACYAACVKTVIEISRLVVILQGHNPRLAVLIIGHKELEDVCLHKLNSAHFVTTGAVSTWCRECIYDPF